MMHNPDTLSPDDLKPAPLSQQQLRKRIRRERLALPIHSRRHAGHAVVRHLRRQPYFLNARKIALYLDAFGEVPTRCLIQFCFKLRKAVYLPIVRKKNHPLGWARLTLHQWQTGRMTRHHFGMRQPLRQRGISLKNFNCIVMPLVAFDNQGHRLGMGGGFYDRSLQGVRGQKKPWRIGLAYDFQRVEMIPHQPWDVALHAVVTTAGYQQF